MALAVTTMPAGSASAEAPVAMLREAMIERLVAMPDVARHKWNSKTAVEDLPREKLVVDAAVDEGRELGLAPRSVRLAVEAQIEAAKIIQSTLIGEWTAAQADPFADVPDLAAVLRPRIQEATARIVRGLAGSLDDLGHCDAIRELRALPVSLVPFARAWETAVDGVMAAAGGVEPSGCGSEG